MTMARCRVQELDCFGDRRGADRLVSVLVQETTQYAPHGRLVVEHQYRHAILARGGVSAIGGFSRFRLRHANS